MDNEICGEITYRVRRYHAPRAHGILKLSYILGLWRDEITGKTLISCLERAGALLRREGDEIYVIYPSLVAERYKKLKHDRKTLKKERDELRLRQNETIQELNILEELREIWPDGWENVELDELEGKISLSLIPTFLYRKLSLEEKEKRNFLNDISLQLSEKEKELGNIEEQMREIGDKLQR